MDPLRHPDLIEISRKLRHQLEMVLAAEQEAAAATLRRRRTVRDRPLEAEDRGEQAWFWRADRLSAVPSPQSAPTTRWSGHLPERCS